jgi:hypothetical protein
MDGMFVHQNTHGGGGVISNGATQWMTSGGGLLHIETSPEELVVSGGLFHGVQMWVKLPSHKKVFSPTYQNLEADLVKLVASPDGGVLARIVAGEIDGQEGPGSRHTPIVVAHAPLARGARLVVPWNPQFNALAYGLEEAGFVAEERHAFGLGKLAEFGGGDALELQVRHDQSLDVLLLGCLPIREPIVACGPFVMNTRDEIQQAFDEYQSGRLGSVPNGVITPYRKRS